MKASIPQYNDSIDIKQLVKSIGRGKWLILLSSLLGLLLAFLFAFGQAAVYKGDVLLQVTSDKNKLPGIDLFTGESTAETELKLITSRNNLAKVVKKLRLNISAKPKRIPLLGNLYKNLFNKDGLDKPAFSWAEKYAWGDEFIRIESLNIPLEDEDKEFTIVSEKDHKFVLLSKDRKVILRGTVGDFSQKGIALDRDIIKVNPLTLNLGNTNEAILQIENELKFVKPEKSKKKIKKSYSLYISALKGKPGTEYVIRRWSELSIIDDLKRRIEATENGVQTGIFSLGLEGQNKEVIVAILDNITGNYLEQTKFRSSEDITKTLSSLENQLARLKSHSDAAEEDLRVYRTENQTADMSAETQAALGIIADIDTELQRLSQKKDEVGQKYTSSHPIIKAIISQVNKLKKRKELAQQKVSELPRTQQKLLKLDKDFSVANKAYINLLNNIQQIKISKASSGAGNIHLIDSAAAHNKPVKPNKKMILILGPLLGAILAMLFLLLRRLLNHKMENPDTLETALEIPVFATVPMQYKVGLTGVIKGSNIRQKSLLDTGTDFSPAIESLRYLRSNLQEIIPKAKNNRVMLTAPCRKVGRFFITSNLAAVMAEGGSKVLLIDADLREGILHELLDRKASPGLSELIEGEADFKDAIFSKKIGNGVLDIITRGLTPVNPSKLLLKQSFSSLIDSLSDQYDIVLIDSPPVNQVSDATVIGKKVATTLMVVHTSMHALKEIDDTVKTLSLAGVKTNGFIFND
jgi:tyrosine-protein kinase Etk/Wzc